MSNSTHLYCRKLLSILMLVLAACSLSSRAEANLEAIKKEVWNTEVAFAKTMADRDQKAFAEFLAEDAVFMGGKRVNRGKQAIIKAWANQFKKEQPPFAWKPERVEVLNDGTLALSTGPVWDDLGSFQTYTSIWRKQTNGKWKVVFDKGDRYCPPEKQK